MYKIYINDTALFLGDESDLKKIPPADDKNLISRYIGNQKSILQHADLLEKSVHFNSVTLYGKNRENLFADFQNLYKTIEAAGGLIFNDQKEILLIFRRGSWDLPKGKIDPGETKEIAALREVEEEVGLSKVELGPFLHTTYHTYRSPKKKKRILKLTYWFKMMTSETNLVLQTEEDIEDGIWINPEKALIDKTPMYANIKDVLRKALDS